MVSLSKTLTSVSSKVCVCVCVCDCDSKTEGPTTSPTCTVPTCIYLLCMRFHEVSVYRICARLGRYPDSVQHSMLNLPELLRVAISRFQLERTRFQGIYNVV